jgi:DNA-binding CsgD family transcriptional regulator
MVVSAFNGGVLSAFTRDLGRAVRIEDSLDALQSVLGKLGWRRLVYGWHSVSSRSGAACVPVITRALPRNWDRNWERHSPNDPYFRVAFESRLPVLWSSVRESAAALPQVQADCLHYIDDLGLGEGLTIPIPVFGRRFAFVTALDRDPAMRTISASRDSTADTGAEAEMIELIAHYFDNHVIGLSGVLNDLQVRISPREQECLDWAAQGKTVDEIALILGISSETVRVFQKRVCAKLNAVNKTHAVAKAIHMGIVTVN